MVFQLVDSMTPKNEHFELVCKSESWGRNEQEMCDNLCHTKMYVNGNVLIKQY